jgi:hypothetical protein
VSKLYKILLISVSAFVLLGTSAFAAEAAKAEAANTTSMGTAQGAAEKYKLEVVAPLVDNSVFPVPVHYFDDLLTKGKRLKAVLLVPMKLTIENSRERRNLIIYTSNINEEVAFGTDLKNVIQVTLSKKDKKAANLITFVGPNKNIFRTSTSGDTYEVNFTIPITQRNFHKSKVRVNVASTNGVQLSEICEVGVSGCVLSTTFTIVPRKVNYKASIVDESSSVLDTPKETFSITASNVDIDLEENNKKLQIVSRKDLPTDFTVAYERLRFNPNTVVKAKPFSHVNNMDLYPVINYMSNSAYRAGDVIMFTNAAKRPDLTIKKAAEAAEVLAQ